MCSKDYWIKKSPDSRVDTTPISIKCTFPSTTIVVHPFINHSWKLLHVCAKDAATAGAVVADAVVLEIY